MNKEYYIFAWTEWNLYENWKVIPVRFNADLLVGFDYDIKINSPLYEIWVEFEDQIYWILVNDFHNIH